MFNELGQLTNIFFGGPETECQSQSKVHHL